MLEAYEYDSYSHFSKSDSKRTRRSPEIQNHVHQVDDRLEIVKTSNLIGSYESYNLSHQLRVTAEIDELKILNEQLEERILNKHEEFEREKEKSCRLLLFLEQENNQLRKAITERNEKYYEEKKKWHTKIRSMEVALENSDQKRENTHISDLNGQMISAAKKNNDNELKLLNKLTEAEALILSKSNDLKQQLKINKDLENQLQKHILANSDRSNKSILRSTDRSFSSDEDISEFKKKINDLEVALRRKTVECDRNTTKIQNQHMLQEEVTSKSLKCSSLEKQLTEYKDIENKIKILNQERKEWYEIFSDAVGNALDQDAITSLPSLVYRMFCDVQKQCAIQSSTISDQTVCIQSLEKEAERNMQKLNESKLLSFEQEKKLETMENKITNLVQQISLYEGEVKGVRDLLRSYDIEFKLLHSQRSDKRLQSQSTADGSCSEQLLEMKDRAVQLLQQELDACRARCIEQQREEEPRFKVLHMISNPASQQLAPPPAAPAPAAAPADGAGTGSDSSKMNTRLKEFFRERINQFREGVYLLTGYKIDLIAAEGGGPAQLRVRSVYAEHPDDALLFQWQEGQLQLLDSPFVQLLDPHTLDGLRRTKSVPVFMAAVCMELFDSQTCVSI